MLKTRTQKLNAKMLYPELKRKLKKIKLKSKTKN